MSQGFHIAVLGASGVVGQSILDILHERDFPIAAIYPLIAQTVLEN